MVRFFRPSRQGHKKTGVKAPSHLDVTGLSSEGKGIARHDGKVVFVDGALPGEQVEVFHYRRGKSHDQCRVKSVARMSPQRTEPLCQHFESCGGCQLQHLEHAQQLALKQQDVLSRMANSGLGEPEELYPALTGSPYEYRSRARFVLDHLGNLCFRLHQSDELVPVSRCPVLTPRLQDLLKNLQKFLSEHSTKPKITHIEFIDSDGDAAIVVRHTRALEPQYLNQLALAIQPVKLFLQGEKGVTPQQFPSTAPEVDLFYEMSEPEIRLHFQPQHFTQINREINAPMIRQAIDWLQPTPHDVVVDLFCGIGNFTIPIAKACGRVSGLELVGTMVEQAHQNGAKNQAPNANFGTANLQQGQLAQRLLALDCQKLLIDPPRSGAKEVCEQIGATNVSKLVYVSCNPATFIRDAIHLKNNGFDFARLRFLDMFPQTSHIELIAMFSKQ